MAKKKCHSYLKRKSSLLHISIKTETATLVVETKLVLKVTAIGESVPGKEGGL